MNPLSFRKNVAGLVGEAVIRLKPSVLEDSAGLLSPTRLSHRFAKAALYRRAVLAGDPSALGGLHSTYWSSPASEFFYRTIQGRALDHLVNHHSEMMRWLGDLTEERRGDFQALCELGCGDGKVLDRLAAEFPGISRFTGVDLSAPQIARTQRAFPGGKLSFIAGDGLEWLERHGHPGLILCANGGVLEYFTERNLTRVFELLASRLKPSAVALIEPLAEDYDLTREQGSRPFGSELTFSHNYLRLAQEAGLEILHHKDARYPFGRRLMLLAATPRA